MSREWERGTVAMVKAHIGQRESLVLRGHDDRWHGSEGIYSHVDDVRPLVVIDPEDAEQTAALAEELYVYGLTVEGWRRRDLNDVGERYRVGMADKVQAALHSLTTPPKPEEPTGLGAVVETANGKRYVRWAEGFFDGRAWAPEDGAANALRWEHIAAVKVLSEGVTP